MGFNSVLNKVFNFFILKRMKGIYYFMNHPFEVQNKVLFTLLEQAKNTEYGILNNFGEIKTYKDFNQKVPIVAYEDFEPFIEKARKGQENVIWKGKIKHFAKSSGTTNAKSKFIPISDESLQNCHYKAGKDLIAIYVNNHRDSNLFKFKNLRLGGSAELYESFGTKFGDLSAILIENLPFWVERTTVPSKKISLMSEWETKLKAIISEVRQENVGSITGVPSWMMVLLQRILKETGKKNISEIYPNLEVFFHGGISFIPYKEQYKQLIGKDIRYYEIYNASEGFFGIQDRFGSDEMLLMLDYGIFYEFIPMEVFGTENVRAISLEEVELNKNYAVVITTNGGLWRYLIGDTIKFTSLKPFRFKISGRTKHYINAFGEELMIDNVEIALSKACQETNAKILDYTGAPIYMKEGESGAHEWVIEFSSEPNDFEKFSQIFDDVLKSLNSDYEAKRYNNMTLKPPVIHKAKPNLFYDWMASRGKLGGQNKVPRLSNDRQYIEPLLEDNI